MSELTRNGMRGRAARTPRASVRLELAARLAVLGLTLAAPPAALAYVGPGAGLGILGVVAAVVAAVVMGFFGLVMWPIRKIAQQRKAHAQQPSHEGAAGQGARRGTAQPPDAERRSGAQRSGAERHGAGQSGAERR